MKLPCPIEWLLASEAPWVRYRTKHDLLKEDGKREREELLKHPLICDLLAKAAKWPGNSTGAHQAGKDLLNQLTALGDFGVKEGDPGISEFFRNATKHTDTTGALLGHVVMPKKKEAQWLLDIDGQDPLLALLGMGFNDRVVVLRAIDALIGLAVESGGWVWPNAPSPLPCRKKVGGCPNPTTKILRILAYSPKWKDSPATRKGTQLLFDAWTKRGTETRYGFGMGDRFARLKYPFIWYDLLHVLEALSQYPWSWKNRAFQEMLNLAVSQADANGRFTPGSVWMEWKEHCFGQKREPSPWLTLLMHRILSRKPNNLNRGKK